MTYHRHKSNRSLQRRNTLNSLEIQRGQVLRGVEGTPRQEDSHAHRRESSFLPKTIRDNCWPAKTFLTLHPQHKHWDQEQSYGQDRYVLRILHTRITCCNHSEDVRKQTERSTQGNSANLIDVGNQAFPRDGSALFGGQAPDSPSNYCGIDNSTKVVTPTPPNRTYRNAPEKQPHSIADRLTHAHACKTNISSLTARKRLRRNTDRAGQAHGNRNSEHSPK